MPVYSGTTRQAYLQHPLATGISSSCRVWGDMRRWKGSLQVPETLALMNEAYEDDKLSRTQVYFWYKRFKDGCKSIADDLRQCWANIN
ncbi:GVQW3 [Cordylochernes scorpioides]|uniref:GVQW3 n=1 Tax=Cordylochernes scorpioides TaxID=51811 RepID=A0ABY6KMK2_9ARAC|nr:GVQW3 [Cordylochernes scorpioides]